jgi:septum formation protein
MGVVFSVCAPRVEDERGWFDGRPVEEALRELALVKAASVARDNPAALVLSGDTVVCHESSVMGKPRSRSEACAMLSALSGTDHEVRSAVALACGDDGYAESRSAVTRVFFRELDPEEIDAYLDDGEYIDKAGAYAIQGKAMTFVEKIAGCYYNVVGLPVSACIGLFNHYRNRKDSNHGRNA